MDSPPIPDELLVDIFLRLPTPADIIRASATCVTFRRLVADRSFVRRFRKLHAPPLLGFLDQRCFHPAVPPHPSAKASGAVAIAADFSFAFLPAPASQWSVRDVRDGRVLLDRPRPYDAGEGRWDPFTEIVVCDPLYRQYRLLPPIPDDLTASVKDPLWADSRCGGETFLVPPDDEEEATHMDETSFRVIWMAQCVTKLVAFVFCSGTGQWRATPSVSWSDLLPGFKLPTWMSRFSWRQYAYGCFYWMAAWSENFLVLDSRRMEFSMADRPPGVSGLCSSVTMAIVEAGEGMTGMFLPAQDTFSLSAHDTHWISYIIQRNSGGSSTHWQMEKTIPMASGCLFMGSLGRHLLLYMCISASLEAGCYTLDVKTFKLERVCASAPIPQMHAYSNFPPSILSSPTVSSGAEGVQVPRRRREPVGPGHELVQHPLQGTGYLFPFTGHADNQGVRDAVPVPELGEADLGGVQGPRQVSADPAGHPRESDVLAAVAQAPNSVFFADTEAGCGGRGGGGEAELAEDSGLSGGAGGGVRGDAGPGQGAQDSDRGCWACMG